MRNLNRLVLALLLMVSFSNVNAQDENNPWAISFGVNAVDVFPVGEDAPQGDYFQEFYNVEDHWSILPSLSTVSVSKYLKDGFSVEVRGSINKITKYGQIDGVNESVKVNDLQYYALDGNVRYHFSELLSKLTKNSTFDPTLGIGGGYTWIEEGPYNSNGAGGAKELVGAGTLNGSVGLNINFSDNLGLSLESKYKHAFEDYLPSHFQHTAAITVKFGGADADGDGVYDKHDACPEVAGLAEFNGCPDSDGDGIEDSKDTCPNEAGLAEFNGCPDTDMDGVSDNNDACPTVKGLKSLAGCPDADKDGVADKDDKCVDVAGPAANNGCPWPDADNDSVLDKDDKCPNVAGTVANNGCPEAVLPTTEVIEKLNSYAKTILFTSGKASFQKATFPVLQSITAILKEYPDANFTIGGHTDSVGSETLNQRLSDTRANAVMGYLVENGISAARLKAIGFGESNPIDSNKTSKGRRNNRRVEVKLVK